MSSQHFTVMARQKTQRLRLCCGINKTELPAVRNQRVKGCQSIQYGPFNIIMERK